MDLIFNIITASPLSPDDVLKNLSIFPQSPFSIFESAQNTNLDLRNCIQSGTSTNTNSGVSTTSSSTNHYAGNTAEFKRFVSPNTANVASALSLLSRLPFRKRF